MNSQNINTEKLYSSVADKYDKYEERADYQVPKILKNTYKEFDIEHGTILDIGCGTGKLSEYLGRRFSYTGIDLSKQMLKYAKSRGYRTYHGDGLKVIKKFGDKSFDHTVLLSSLYLMKDINELIKEVLRVTKISVFITLEQATDSYRKSTGKEVVLLFNHPISILQKPTKILSDVYLWKRPIDTREKVFGHVIFKKL